MARTKAKYDADDALDLVAENPTGLDLKETQSSDDTLSNYGKSLHM